jgi:hypothetical protein
MEYGDNKILCNNAKPQRATHDRWPVMVFFYYGLNVGAKDAQRSRVRIVQPTKMKPVDIGGHLKKRWSKDQQKNPAEIVTRHKTEYVAAKSCVKNRLKKLTPSPLGRGVPFVLRQNICPKFRYYRGICGFREEQWWITWNVFSFWGYKRAKASPKWATLAGGGRRYSWNLVSRLRPRWCVVST